MDLSRTHDGATTDDRTSPSPATEPEPGEAEVVEETKCCCFFKRKIKKAAKRN
jgi:hypothetical protein